MSQKADLGALGPAEPHAARWPEWAAWSLVFLLAFYLRWHQLLDQILSDDEWHAVRTSVRDSYRQMLTSFSTSAVPLLSMIYKALHDTVGLSELKIRLPMLLAGLALIVVFPAILPRDLLSRRGRLLLAGLLAISPLLIYFSRYARPYAISVLLTTVGLFAFFRWWRRDQGRWGTLYVICGVFGPAFHLTSLVTLAAPFAWAFYEVWRGRGERSAGEVWRLGFLTGFLVLLAVGPPILLDFGAIEDRAGTNQVDYLTFRESLPLLAGLDGPGVWLVAAAALSGLFLLARRNARLAAMLGWASLVTLLANALSGANSVQVPIVFLRYSLWLAPYFLLLVAISGDALLAKLPTKAAWPILALLLLGLFLAGPWRHVYARPNSWPHHAIFQYTYRGESPFSYARRPPVISELYRQLAKEPAGSLVIAEAPFYSEWHNNVLTYYQEIHHQRVVAGMLGIGCDRMAINRLPSSATGLKLRNVVDVSKASDLEQHGVDLVIFHKNMYRELPPFSYQVSRVPASNLPPANRLVSCLPRYAQVLGTPFFEDEAIVAYDIRPRRGRPAEDEKLFFRDGFESGDTSAWSRATP